MVDLKNNYFSGSGCFDINKTNGTLTWTGMLESELIKKRKTSLQITVICQMNFGLCYFLLNYYKYNPKAKFKRFQQKERLKV